MLISVGDKLLKTCYKVYNLDSPVGEVYKLEVTKFGNLAVKIQILNCIRNPGLLTTNTARYDWTVRIFDYSWLITLCYLKSNIRLSPPERFLFVHTLNTKIALPVALFCF